MSNNKVYKVVILAYPGMTMLDAIGPNEVLANSPYFDVTWVTSDSVGIQNDHNSFLVTQMTHFQKVNHADILLIPGGPGDKAMMHNPVILEWIKQIDSESLHTTSVCTGSLVLAATGLLDGHKACSHWACLSELASLGAHPVRKRFVRSGKYITASGVSAGIDMALFLVEQLIGRQHAKQLRFGIEYFPSQLNLLSTYTLPAGFMAKLEKKVSGFINHARTRYTP